MQIVFASSNKNKILEIQSILPETIHILSLEDIGCLEEIPETADTIEGNAILKANYVTEKFGLNCFADDTGLEVEALNNEPGVYSARYAGKENNSEANMQKLLKNLENESNKKAQFKTAIALNINGKQFIFEGICKGQILTKKQGEEGFGYDPIFMPDNFNQSFAEMTMKEKARISHRGLAIQELVTFLKNTHW